ncbi:hypothetical protein Plhal304r1_c091g0171701 [Plasmopara halstedii]
MYRSKSVSRHSTNHFFSLHLLHRVSTLASQIVYCEGLMFMEVLPDLNSDDIVVQYLKQKKRVQRVVLNMRLSSLLQFRLVCLSSGFDKKHFGHYL